MHVDALCVEKGLFLSSLCCAFTEQAASQAFGLHDDSIVCQCGQDWSQVEVHLAHRQHQVNLWRS